MTGAMLAAIAINSTGHDLTAGNGIRFASFAAVGWTIGSEMNRRALTVVRSNVVPIVVIVTSLLVVAVAIAFGLRLLGLDGATSSLAASPGGFTQMAALSAEMNASVAVVVTAHVARVVAVVLAMPLLSRLVA